MESKNYSNLFCGYAKIYSLSDINGNVFYVGCTVKPIEKRIYAHINSAKAKYIYSGFRNLQKIKELNFEIIATVIDMMWVTGPTALLAMYKASKLERYWIEKHIELGYEMTNKPIKSPSRDGVSDKIGQVVITSKCGKMIIK